MASARQQPTAATPSPSADASMQRVTAENGIEYAYRDIDEGDLPLVLLQHFRGNLDNWDPALMDALAADRRVVAFDGVAGADRVTHAEGPAVMLSQDLQDGIASLQRYGPGHATSTTADL
jgi:pimeloyl-ACP methyl ester carboxylesterase